MQKFRIYAILAASLLASSVLPAHSATLRFGAQGDVTSFDPYVIDETFSSGFLGNVYEGLVRRAADLSIEPALAESWETLSPTHWRFHLRKGVKFHDGSPFTADDVLFSAARIRAPGSDFKNRLSPDTKVIKVDDYTVDFVTDVPNPIIYYQWGNWYMMSKAWAEKHNDHGPQKAGGEESFATLNENGTGAFKLTSREPGIKTVLVANPDWWGASSRQDNVTDVIFTPIPNSATRVAALLSGQLDMITPVPLQDIDRIKANPGTTVITGPELRTVYLFMDQFRPELLYSNIKGKNPLKDHRVREALYRAIDIEALKSKVMRGMSTPTALMVAPGINGSDPSFKRIPYDPAKAKALLAEAGYPDGFEIGLDCPNDRYVNDEAICVAVGNMFAKVGIKVKVNAQTKTKFFDKVLAPKLDFSLGLIGSTPPSFDSWAPINSLHQCPRVSPSSEVWAEGERDKVTNGKSNYGGYCNPEVDKLAEQILKETDQKKRNDLIKQVWTITTGDIAYLPLHQQWLAWGVGDGVELKQRADDVFDWRYVKITK
ncbi:ABC transporter substrate-binding protein [Rhizobium rhizogenes]|uniref:ABC transporter substrate-binding protein n=1 Tax=Rhizobium rhizogenes TaxID=359 RepID=UPI001573112B|nr:ABC transporter substrate-binding protein [Rhizobium rhizogenes]NTI39519.1 ABC transporter substrate-binding protein [Rhizobium rhizogenes]WEO67921.1 ABC transporter substrate-binding protein [Rhizobium rhizogenes]